MTPASAQRHDRRIVAQRIVFGRQLHDVADVGFARQAGNGQLVHPRAALALLRRVERRLHELEDLGHALDRCAFHVVQVGGQLASDSARAARADIRRILSRAWASEMAVWKLSVAWFAPTSQPLIARATFCSGVSAASSASRSNEASRAIASSFASAAISLAKPSASRRPFSSAIFATCALSSIEHVFAAGVLGRVLVQQLADLLQRFAGDAFGGKLREQIAGELVLAGFGAKLNFLEDQPRAELAQLPDVLLADPCVRESP